ncbi:unnamed protein product [Ambrosiozyma monospora]|uniref:Unnamed protein product n=1 Tax=Ambrosiozyma monospora TaxID=43982 RepID=A0A9W6Z5T4_AMBMO|nr:unnamed protein product [Ambrosiozyma monospora]
MVVWLISRVEEGHSALIIGGGPIGLTTLFALKGHKSGKIVISEPAKARRELAKSLGAEVYDPTGKSLQECVNDLKALSPNGAGFNRTYDCSGLPITFQTSIKTLTVRGIATNVAVWAHKHVEYEPMHITFSEMYVTGSICFVKKDFEESVKAFEDGLIPIDEVRKLITSKVYLRDGVEKGFKELINHKEKHVKILFSAFDELIDE